jgi:PleD family two-component response regulator
VTGDLPVTVSVGATTAIPDDAAQPSTTLIEAADRNLYAAKRGGRDQVVADHQPTVLPRRYRDASRGDRPTVK